MQTGEDKEDSWCGKYQKILETKNRSMSSCIINEASPWFKTLTPRTQMVLGNALSENPDICYCDVYQSMQREFTSKDAMVVSTICPGSIIWSIRHKRPILGAECLMIQGMPPSIVEIGLQEFSDSNLMDLAGNMFTGMAYAACAILRQLLKD